ncbi:MAG: DUF839 domain-containing protein [Bdellovibrionales bacterium]|nr:DUF839 domain-containing protein [Bdellovibrionales bacterium]
MNEISRRQFLDFMGRAAALSLLPACALPSLRGQNTNLPFTPLKPTGADDLILASGLEYKVVTSWGDILNPKQERVGFNNDFLAFIPLDPRSSNEGLLWMNNEYHDPYYTRGWRPGQEYTAADIVKDRKEVGGTIVHLRKREGEWTVVVNSKYNRRLDGFTPIPLISEQPIFGTHRAIGTMGGCAGGVTPWGTILSCEENYHNFVGEVEFLNGKRTHVPAKPYLSWAKGPPLPPEHYGWVVEVDPRTGRAKKLTALGRFAHESATCIQAADGRTVVYSGDDSDQEHLYKFISAKPGSLEKGELFVADIPAGRWRSLAREKDLRLKAFFKNQTELLVRTREAAKMIGATPLNRPEDIDIDPLTRNVFVSCTAGSKGGADIYGSLLKIEEKDADPLSLEFTASTFLAGGPENGFANPDNLLFDPKGNLWMCTDISESKLNTPAFASFANNGLFYIPFSGAHAGKPLQVASAPRGAELTGACFSPDFKTLFLSVQHPGERVHKRPQLESHWPGGGDSVPKPSVVAIRGPTLESLLR